ncbi:helix-turn-helix domain-containing protein [Desulfofundulus thermosubterraneus]|uniref:DNA-binding transcriptional regulator, XRE family n=1 Tax=Desulfofundulus thermosubterraneus DSM 16057 TaxID=1121432 RepID=A0A1M6JGZ5_9FIRM|nr:helix-turn-helix domain-containing protein [Desulfofundulus thermosubterraneus]SHJ45989.1 DNA-binding transcriptional regulator, XRE family [Desulfofundulus thermosubterraneus DSM 16057]
MFTYKPLLKTLIDKDLKLQDLREKLRISGATLAKISKGEYVSMETLDKICGFLDCEIQDVIQHVKKRERN